MYGKCFKLVSCSRDVLAVVAQSPDTFKAPRTYLTNSFNHTLDVSVLTMIFALFILFLDSIKRQTMDSNSGDFLYSLAQRGGRNSLLE